MKNKCEKCSMDALYLKADSDGLVHYFCEHHNLKDSTKIGGVVEESNLKKFTPFILIILSITILSSIRQFIYGTNAMMFMMDFMGIFLITFGFLKLYDLKGFVDGYQSYDLIAKNHRWYGYAYPFFEIILGAIYIFGYMFLIQNLFVLVFALIGMFTAFRVIRNKQEIKCVCLGTAFNLPMTWVTFGENLLMATMMVLMINQSY